MTLDEKYLALGSYKIYSHTFDSGILNYKIRPRSKVSNF